MTSRPDTLDTGKYVWDERLPALAKAGWLRHKQMPRSLLERAQTGRFVQEFRSDLRGEWNEPPRPLHERRLRDIFLDVASTPP
jgi:hypothetical protein